MSVDERKLDFWLERDKNVLFKGRHGVGKTTMVIEAFTRAGLKWKYFSAATMDPWVDFIGVPKEHTTEDGDSYLELVLPKEFRDDEVEAIFFDELNRSHKKVRNAVMELIQFKSINGRKFQNLRVIWAAVNPEEDEDLEYDVEKLDAAQADRFHVQIELPYELSKAFFTKKYGAHVAVCSIEWWDALPDESKLAVSPRRMDYALQHFLDAGDLRDVLFADGLNVTKLQKALIESSVQHKMSGFMATKDAAGAKNWLSDPNECASALPFIMTGGDDILKFYLPALPEEVFAQSYSTNANVRRLVGSDLQAAFTDFLDEQEKIRGVTLDAEGNSMEFAIVGTKWNHTPYTPGEFMFEVVNQKIVADDTNSRRHAVARLLTRYPKEPLTLDQYQETFAFLEQLARKMQVKSVLYANEFLPLVNSLGRDYALLNPSDPPDWRLLAPKLSDRMKAAYPNKYFKPKRPRRNANGTVSSSSVKEALGIEPDNWDELIERV